MRKLVTIALVTNVLLGGCRSSNTDGGAAASSSDARSAPKSSSAAGVSQDASELRAQMVRDGDAVSVAFRKLERAAKSQNKAQTWAAYLQLRRAFRRLLPIAGLLTYSSTLDPDDEEPDEVPSDLGLRPLGDALLVQPPDFDRVGLVLTRTRPAARLAGSEARTCSLRQELVAHAVSEAVFKWGVLLDGSAAESPEEASIDAMAGGRAWTAYARLLAAAGPSKGAMHVQVSARKFDAWLDARQKEPGHALRDKLTGLLLSARLGGALRELFALRGAVVPAPFAPLQDAPKVSSHAAAVSVATFPRLPGPKQDPALVQLGRTLFFDKRLSANGNMSCASCHLDKYALSAGPKRPRSHNGKPLARDVPGLLNIAYEPMFFWDGRASTLARQVEIAVERDMGGNWSTILERLAQLDAGGAGNSAIHAVLPGGLTKENVQAAIAEFERSLVDASAPFDRYVQGQLSALNPEQLRGFDVYYGVARCSRCHRLPLTSGAAPPRFTTTELSAIFVPASPKAKRLDADQGRGAITERERDAHAFKVPTLRNLARTAPYFHNGAFKTLEQVVDFYSAGSGFGVGIAKDNFDPDARAFTLSKEDRAALLTFLRDGLAHQPPAPAQ
ncbi:MAG TPA: cytochrome c peroxidase [Polyangiaceae bacterium]|nr:cytochrome c peroxidase [Polyangiaceae bacterium]